MWVFARQGKDSVKEVFTFEPIKIAANVAYRKVRECSIDETHLLTAIQFNG